MKTLIFFSTLVLFFCFGCSSKMFVITSVPESTLVRYGNRYTKTSIGETGNSGINYNVQFFGKRDSGYFFAMKRGYQTDSVKVRIDSDPAIKFDLTKLDLPLSSPDYAAKLNQSDLWVLPTAVKAIYHKGVGNVGSYEASPVESDEIAIELTGRLSEEFSVAAGTIHSLGAGIVDTSGSRVPEAVLSYLLSLDPALLRYYSKAPAIALQAIQPQGGDVSLSDRNEYIAIVYCKTIKPTGGRVAGNIIAGGLAGAMNTPGAYNTDAFNLDNSTLINLFFIHRPSGEVVKISQQALQYDIINEKGRKAVVQVILSMLSAR